MRMDGKYRHRQFEAWVRRGSEGRAPIIHISVLVTSSVVFIQARGRGRCRLNLTKGPVERRRGEVP